MDAMEAVAITGVIGLLVILLCGWLAARAIMQYAREDEERKAKAAKAQVEPARDAVSSSGAVLPPPCKTCSHGMTFAEEYKRWYCARCNQYA